MAAQHHGHPLLWIVTLGGAGYLAWRYLLDPTAPAVTSAPGPAVTGATGTTPILQPATNLVTDQSFLNTEYETVLDRAPDTSGDAYWLSVIAQQRAAGVPEAQIQANIAAAFANSTEAAALAAAGY